MNEILTKANARYVPPGNSLIVDSICTLCMEHEWAGVVGGREGRNLVGTEINKSSRQAEMIMAISTWHYTIMQMFITKSLHMLSLRSIYSRHLKIYFDFYAD